MIVGGGYDNLLPLLLHKNIFEQITFVDISPGMITKMKARCRKMSLPTENKVDFICADITKLTTGSFNAIFLPFVLDILPDNKLQTVMSVIDARLEAKGTAYLLDFRKVDSSKHPLQAAKLRLLHIAFLPFARMKRIYLPDFDENFAGIGMQNILEKTYFNAAYTFRIYERTQPKSTAANVTRANW